MTDDVKNNENQEESFADLFESYEAGMGENVKVGDKITGKVIAITANSVFVETGTKIDGVADREELLDENGELPLKEGDSLELYVVSVSASEIRLSKAMTGIGGLKMLEEAAASGVPVEGKVTGTCKGGFNVQVLHRRAFCPISQIDNRFVEDQEAYVNQTYQFAIIKFEQGGRNIVVSRRELLMREQAESIAKFLETVKEGDIIEGTVARTAPYGAFVEIAPGLEGLVHISELGWARVEDPAEVVKPGDKVQVKLLETKAGAKPGQYKISLSMKQAQQDPWETIGEKIKAGDKVTGTVSRLTKFGAFVEILPGIDGLIHLSEMSYEKRVMRADEVVKPGEQVSVVVKDIDLDQKRVSLSLKDAAGDPWMTVEEKFSEGQKVTGTVEKQEQFGIFVNLMPGVTGLLPKSMIAKSEKPGDYENLKPGNEVELTIHEINIPARKITLSTGTEKDTEEWKSYKPKKPAAPKGEAFGGLLGAKLKEAMKKKK